MGPRPATTAFPELNDGENPVVPAGIPNWSTVMDTWGSKLLATALTVSELLAASYGMPSEQFADLMREGPHLLAPTGTTSRIMPTGDHFRTQNALLGQCFANMGLKPLQTGFL